MPLEPLAAAGRSSTTPPSGGLAHGERRLITILFADLSGFTALSSNLDPEDVREVANVCFSFLNTAIIARGGTVHKYEGDLVIALFGYPAAHEDDPERAIQAGFEMFDLLDSINRAVTLRLKLKTTLGLHIGISCGTVVVGEVGTPEKREHTVMGDTVNLASRLKDAAKRGEILVSEPVYRASRYRFVYAKEEPVSAKGMEQPVKVFRPLREKETPDPKRGIPGLSSPMVGRDRELGLLQGAVRRLAEGKGGATFVLGDPGLGKSRLLEELEKSVSGLPSPVTWLEGRCISHGETLPYWPFLQMLREAFGIADQDSLDAVKEKLSGRVRDLFPTSWGETLPFLGYLFSVRFSEEIDERGKYLDPQGLKVQIFLSVRKTFAALARERPLLLVIEDYHWIDAVSLEFLEYLLDAPERLPLACLCLSRVEKDKAGHRTKERLKKKLAKDFSEILLHPLDAGEVTRLFQNLLQVPGIPKRFKDRILAKAEGNPFCLEEILRSLIDAGTLVFSAGIWVHTSGGTALAVPDTVQAVIASRLDRLEPEVRETLQTAAVIGRSFQVPVLEHLWGHDPMLVMLYLADLEEHGFIREVKRDPEWEFTFCHPLLHEVAYTSLLKTARRRLHCRTGEAIEALYPDRLEDFCELVASQYAEGDDPEKAVEWLRKAGQKAAGRYANDEAIACYRRAAALLEEELTGRDGDLVAVQEALGGLYSQKGDYESAVGCYREIERRARDEVVLARAGKKIAYARQYQGRYDEALGILEEVAGRYPAETPEARLERADLCICRGGVYWVKGEMDRALKEGRKGLEIALELPEEDPKVMAIRASGYNRLGAVHFDQGECARAVECYEKSIALLRERGDKGGVARISGNLAVAYQVQGELAKALETYQAGLAIMEEIGDKASYGSGLNNVGSIHYALGDYDRAGELFERALLLAGEIGNQRSLGIARGNLGTVREARGQDEKAVQEYRLCLDTFEAIGYKKGISEACVSLGRLQLRAGKFREAEHFLERAEGILEGFGHRDGLVEVFLLRAELLNAQAPLKGRPAPAALEYAGKALRLGEESKSGRSRAMAQVTFGKLYDSADDFKKAEGHYRKAIALFEEEKQKPFIAAAYLDYARLLARAPAGTGLSGKAGDYFRKARALFQAMNLPHKVQECR
jgi:class 3 adenylate cyclase/tetratricopeptide (TPR) repeat protein